MSQQEGGDLNTSNTDNCPSVDQIIDEVIESCKDLKVEPNSKQDEHVEENKEIVEDGQCEVETDTAEDFIDDVYLKELESTLSPEKLEENKLLASDLKAKGNTAYKSKNYDEARNVYTAALKVCPLSCTDERAILFSNRAACKMAQDLKNEAISDCSRAVELNPTYVKALIRRANLYEQTEKLDEALEDYKKILELDPGNGEARAACMRLPAEINTRNEKLKAEMVSSLKEIGNMILKPFGLSTNNFQIQQDPNSGSYSINFKQNPK